MASKEFCDVRITVLKKLELLDIHQEYAASAHTTCTMVKEGLEFISRNCSKPDGFCNWAWVGAQPRVAFLAMGHDYPWTKQKGVEIFSCSDGLHPVIYKLERIEQDG
jgi:uncharacterized repeat protein (TIGR04076 family)